MFWGWSPLCMRHVDDSRGIEHPDHRRHPTVWVRPNKEWKPAAADRFRPGMRRRQACADAKATAQKVDERLVVCATEPTGTAAGGPCFLALLGDQLPQRHVVGRQQLLDARLV